jgi:hypothetical protein
MDRRRRLALRLPRPGMPDQPVHQPLGAATRAAQCRSPGGVGTAPEIIDGLAPQFLRAAQSQIVQAMEVGGGNWTHDRLLGVDMDCTLLT